MSPVRKTKTKATDLIRRLAKVRMERLTPSQFEFRQFKHEAEKLKDADPAAAFTALGIIAGLQGDIPNMRNHHTKAIAYSRDQNTLYNYAVSLSLTDFLEESVVYAKEAFEIASLPEMKYQALNLLIELYHLLEKEEEFIDYAYKWESVHGKPHRLMNLDLAQAPTELDSCLDLLERQVSEDQNSFVEIDPSELTR